jgi:hypothetical protein
MKDYSKGVKRLKARQDNYDEATSRNVELSASTTRPGSMNPKHNSWPRKLHADKKH